MICMNKIADTMTFISEEELQILFGSEIAKLRKQCKYKQLELAEKAGISGQQLSNIEKGRCAPSLKTINKILLALNARLRIEPL